MSHTTNFECMDTIVFFERGCVTGMLPEPAGSFYESRDLINAATLIVSDGKRYDLNNVASIHSIPIPKYETVPSNDVSAELGTTGYLDYVLRMHASFLWNNAEYDLAITCLRQACLLMLYSPIGWQRKDYYRIVNWLLDLGSFKKAQEWRLWIEKHTTNPSNYAIEAFMHARDECRFLGTDLVEVGDLNACCEICAAYRKRIYSLSGSDRRFPKFPGNFHFQCGLHISPFIDRVSIPAFKCRNIVKYSNRPFEDDRTPEERTNYVERLELIAKTEKYEKAPDLNRIIYHWAKSVAPNDVPKSVSAFSRMRNENSPKYQQIIEKLTSAGFKIPRSLEDVAQWDANRG